jgi:hypothetical protein
MADLKILKKNGYEEPEGVEAAIKDGALDIKALWVAVGQGDTARAALILFEAGFGEDGEEVEHIKDVVVVSVPDDILGEHYRIWIKSSFTGAD